MRRLLAAAGPLYMTTGVLHFLIPKVYERAVPDYLPAHRELVYASGVAEFIGGAALLHPDPKVRRFGGWFETLTMVAVFPANIHMALNPDDFKEFPGGRAGLYARLPLQAGFIAWALAAAKR
jgi:uncharacterized membrane protein